VLSKLAVASVLPVGAQASARTVRVCSVGIAVWNARRGSAEEGDGKEREEEEEEEEEESPRS
jgi:hypothetical protein